MKSQVIFILSVILIACSNGSNNKDLIKYYISNVDSVRVVHDGVSGYRKSIAVIKDGKENGLFKTYYENGRTKEIGLMHSNLKEGLWMTFDPDSTLLKVAHFSNGTLITELDKTDFHFIKRGISDNDSDSMTLSIPLTWEISKHNNNAILLGIHKRCDSVLFCPNLVLTSYDEVYKKPFSDFINNYSNVLKQNYEDVQIVFGNRLKINQNDAYQMGVKLKKENVNLASSITLIKHLNKIYVLTGMVLNEVPGEFFKYKGLFEQIAATFAVTNKNLY